jgi:kumamolisin
MSHPISMLLLVKSLRFIGVVLLCLTGAPSFAQSGTHRVQLKGHVPHAMLARSHYLEPMDAAAPLDLVIGLPLRHVDELEQLIRDLHDPGSPSYGKYLTPEQFRDQFGPEPGDVEMLASYFREAGYQIGEVSQNRSLLHVRAPVATVEHSFNIRMNHYHGPVRNFFAASQEPSLPAEIAARILNISGLQNAQLMKPHIRRSPAVALSTPSAAGTGPSGGLSPQNIQTIYSFPGGAINGQGQTIGLFEMDGYNPSDISAYTNYFKLQQVPLENVLIGGVNGSPGDQTDEVVMDIQLANAIAPGASKILVYEAPNTSQGTLDLLNRMASDNRASVISISWGSGESDITQRFAEMEGQIFRQMAAQGQTVLVAAGDSGAYDVAPPTSTSVLTVVDPASQPYVTGAGGTTLQVSSPGVYGSEKAWNQAHGATGGGVSSFWPIPDWQKGVATAYSTTARNVPDVALDADSSTGYSIYVKGKWSMIAGTSAAAPIWAGFVALANQSRALKGEPSVGFMNPRLYRIGAGSSYNANFHDVLTGNNNYYNAGIGFDNTTGWGSLQATNLLGSISTASQRVTFLKLPTSMEWGQTIDLKGVAVASSGLPVTYSSAPTTVCQVKDTLLTAELPGNCIVTASQVGNETFDAASTSASISVVQPTYPGVNRTLTVQSSQDSGTVASSPAGIQCGADGNYCAQAFTRNMVVTLRATPSMGHVFSRWSGACSGKAPTCRVKMSSNRQVKALFK